MRYSRYQDSRKRKQPNKAPSAMLVIIIIGIIVYFVSAGAVGTFISSNIVNPVIAFFSGEQAAEPTPKPSPSDIAGGDTITEQITIESKTLYAIQAGVFTDQKNASALAKSVQNQGGAGYIKEEGSYRVLLSAYKTEEEAKSVKSKLLEQNGMQTSVHEMICSGASLEITAPEETIALVKEAISMAFEYVDQLYNISMSSDKKELNIEEAASAVENIKTRAVGYRDSLDQLQNMSENETVKALFALYTELVERMDIITKSNITDTEFSAGIKQSYLNLFDNICSIVNGI